MSKYTYEQKLKAVLDVINEGLTMKESAKLLGCESSLVYKWIGFYKQHGSEALKNYYTRYSGDFKIMVVEYMYANCLSCYVTSIKFGIRKSETIDKWRRIYDEEGPEGLLETKSRELPSRMNKTTTSEENRNKKTEKELIAENERLRMENAYLKKLNALVQKRIARENGKEPPSSMN